MCMHQWKENSLELTMFPKSEKATIKAIMKNLNSKTNMEKKGKRKIKIWNKREYMYWIMQKRE